MNQKISLLAIDPGIREIGIAHFEGNELIDFGVKSMRRPEKNPPPLHVLRKVMERLIAEKQLDIIAMEKNGIAGAQQNLLLAIAVERIKSMAVKINIPVHEFVPATIRKAVTGSGWASKGQVSQAVCGRFPELKNYRKARTRSQTRYWQNLFDAVACGLTFLKIYGQGSQKE
jgi:crossover junction endodeoxyribonuclease RuvC